MKFKFKFAPQVSQQISKTKLPATVITITITTLTMCPYAPSLPSPNQVGLITVTISIISAN